MDAYPEQLAALVRRQWHKSFRGESFYDLPVYPASQALPRSAALRKLLSISYQASLLREEGRAVRFRLILSEPASLSPHDALPDELHAFPFAKPLELTPDNLRRLAAAAAFERTLIGARARLAARFEIWGLVHSGEQWLRALEGSRRSFPALPPYLVVNATGPGNLTVGRGSLAVARLLGGRVVVPTPSLLEISDREGEDQSINALLLASYERARRHHGRQWASMSAALIGLIRRQTALRLLSAMRRLNHGGTLLILPPTLLRNPRRWQRVLKLKYAFVPGPPRRRLFTLVSLLIEALARDCGQRFGPDHQVTWRDYLTSPDDGVRQADEAITETVRFLACLSAVDGAVVMGQPLQLVGFGAEISGRLPPVDHVVRALNPSGTRTRLESALNVGTRHRSAYRLCRALPGVLAVVVSQDGLMRVMRRAGNHVMYSEHLGTGALDL